MVSKKIETEAKRLYALAKANGTLKEPRCIGAVGTYSDHRVRTVSMSAVTWRDYIVDARRSLAA